MRGPCTATKSSPRSLQLEKARAQQRRPNAAKKKKVINVIVLEDVKIKFKNMAKNKVRF